MPSGIWRVLSFAAPALVGLASGLAGSAYFARARTGADVPSGQSVSAVTTAVPVEQGSSGDTLRQVAELRAMLEAQRDTAAAGSSEQKQVPHADRDPERMSPEESAAKHLASHQAAIAAHRGDGRDPRWAPVAEASFRKDIAALGDIGTTDVSIDCRMSSCTADLEWPTFAAAREKYGRVLHSALTMNCAREILLPEPADPSRPYRATAVFDCESARAEAP